MATILSGLRGSLLRGVAAGMLAHELPLPMQVEGNLGVDGYYENIVGQAGQGGHGQT